MAFLSGLLKTAMAVSASSICRANLGACSWTTSSTMIARSSGSRGSWSSRQGQAAKLLDSYLSEVALDSNILPSKFISLAELLPDHARLVTDGLYRAVDIFLKARIPTDSFIDRISFLPPRR